MKAPSIVLPDTLDRNELKQIIVDAVLEIDKARESKRLEEGKQRETEWHKNIGYYDYSTEKRWIKRWFFTFFNRIKIFFTLMFLRKKKIKGDAATVSLLKTFLSLCLKAVQYTLLLIAIISIVAIFYSPQGNKLPLNTAIPMALITFIFSRLFRMASIEVENINDRSYIFNLFACVTALISIVIAVIAIVK